jgi:hypothetical protein
MKSQKIIILFLFLLIAFYAKSQSETVIDTVKTNLIKPEKDTKPSINLDYPQNMYPLRLFPLTEKMQQFKSPYSQKYFELPKFDYALESYMAKSTPNLLAARSPFAYDFSHGGIMPLSSNSFISAFQSRKTYMLIGTLENVGGSYTFFTDRLRVTTGISADKYRENEQIKYDANINAEIQYLLSTNAKLTLFGTYSLSPAKDVFSRGMYSGRPQTYYGGNVQFSLFDMLDLKTGVYGANYSINGRRNNDFGFNADIGLWVTDRLKIAGMGQYSLYNNNGAMSQGMGMYPQTYYGGYLEFKVNDIWGVRGGALRQFDIRKGKWITVPYFEIVSYK